MNKILPALLTLALLAGCQPAGRIGPTLTAALPLIEDGSAKPAVSPTLQLEAALQPEATLPPPPAATHTLAEPASPSTQPASLNEQSTNMPLFLEISLTTVTRSAPSQGPVMPVGPAAFSYDPGTKVLMVSPVLPDPGGTELLVGLIEVLELPDQVFENRQILASPTAVSVDLQVLSIQAGTGAISLQYRDEIVQLSPGDSVTFKESGSGNSNSVIATFTNHGRLRDIQTMPADSWR